MSTKKCAIYIPLSDYNSAKHIKYKKEVESYIKNGITEAKWIFGYKKDLFLNEFIVAMGKSIHKNIKKTNEGTIYGWIFDKNKTTYNDLDIEYDFEIVNSQKDGTFIKIVFKNCKNLLNNEKELYMYE